MKELNIPAIAGAGCALAATVAYKNNDPVTASLCLTASVVAAAARFVQNCRGNNAVFCAPSCCKCITRPVCKLFSLGTSPLLTSAASLALPVVSSLSLTKTFSTILAPTVAGVHVEGAVRTVFDKTLPTCSSRLPKAISWMATSALAGTAGVVSSLYLGQLFSGEDESLLSELTASNSGLAAAAFSGLLLSTIMQLSSKTLSCLCKPRLVNVEVNENDQPAVGLGKGASGADDDSERPEHIDVVEPEVSNSSGMPEASTSAAAAVVANPAAADAAANPAVSDTVVDPEKEIHVIVEQDQPLHSAPPANLGGSELLASAQERVYSDESQREDSIHGLLPDPVLGSEGAAGQAQTQAAEMVSKSDEASNLGNGEAAVLNTVTDTLSEYPERTVELRVAVRRKSQPNAKPTSLNFDANAADNRTFTIEAEISHTAGLTAATTVPESVDSSESTPRDPVASTKPALSIVIPEADSGPSAMITSQLPPLHPNAASGTPMVIAQKSPPSSSSSSSSSPNSTPRSKLTTTSTAFPFTPDTAADGLTESLADLSTAESTAQLLVNSQTSTPQPSPRSLQSSTPNWAVRTNLLGFPSRQSTGKYTVSQNAINDVLARSRRGSQSQETGQLDAATEAAKSISRAAGGSKPVTPSSFTRSLSGVGLSAFTFSQPVMPRRGSNAATPPAEAASADTGGIFSNIGGAIVSALVSATMPYAESARSTPSTPRATKQDEPASRRYSVSDLVNKPGFMSAGRSVIPVDKTSTGEDSSVPNAAQSGSKTPTRSQWVNVLNSPGRRYSMPALRVSGSKTPTARSSLFALMQLPGLVSTSVVPEILANAGQVESSSDAQAEFGTPPLLDSREYTPVASNAGTPMKQSNGNHQPTDILAQPLNAVVVKLPVDNE